MQLKPVIAAYTGEVYTAITRALTPQALQLAARVTEAPTLRGALDGALCEELEAMHVFREVQGRIYLNTAVFLADDIARVNRAALAVGADLASLVEGVAAGMRDEPPVTRNFLIGIMGIGQSLGQFLREMGVAVDWGSWGGRYGRSKVDFCEVCDAQEALGPDLQNKNIRRGADWTLVLIGPRAGRPGLRRAELESQCETLTEEEMLRYRPVVRQVGEVARRCFAGRVGELQALLRTTASGRQGVEPSYMMMHLWRYLRRAVARQLYTAGFFTDKAPETGVIAIRYASDLGDLNALLR